MNYNKNAVGRDIPEYLGSIGELVPFKGEVNILELKERLLQKSDTAIGVRKNF